MNQLVDHIGVFHKQFMAIYERLDPSTMLKKRDLLTNDLIKRMQKDCPVCIAKLEDSVEIWVELSLANKETSNHLQFLHVLLVNINFACKFSKLICLLSPPSCY